MNAIRFSLLLFLAASTRMSTEGAELDKTVQPSRKSFSVHAVDKNNKDIANALVGRGASLVAGRDTEWQFWAETTEEETKAAVTGVDGTAQMFVDEILQDKLVLLVRHREKKLIGLREVSRKELVRAADVRKPLVVQMVSECRVSGHVVEQSPASRVAVSVRSTDLRWIATTIISTNKFELFLPPGDYELRHSSRGCYDERIALEIEEGERNVQLPNLQLAIRKNPVGKEAPELRRVLAWKNSESLKLTDLRGKYVLLDFWGCWCGGCLPDIKGLMDLHDKYSRRGLVIIGVHVGLDDDPVTTVQQLDDKLIGVRETIWGGRDIPYPVAIVESRISERRGGIGEERSLAAKDYAVDRFPTKLLIDRKGTVLGNFDLEKHTVLFEQLPPVD